MRKWLVRGLILGVLLLVGGYFGHGRYVDLRQARLLKQARHYLEKPDYRRALLCLQRAVHYQPNNVEACRLMAQACDLTHSPNAVNWRSRVLELNPGSLTDRLALAQTALRAHDYIIATNALAGVDHAGQNSAPFHNIAGAVALLIGDYREAEHHFLEAVRLEPDKPVPQLNLAIVHLHDTHATVAAEGRVALQRLSSKAPDSSLRCMAQRELISDALLHGDDNAALALTKELLQETNSVFEDRLLRLDVLQAAGSAEFRTALVAVQNEAGSDVTLISEIATWEITKNSPAAALGWLETLPPPTRNTLGILMLTAECRMSMQDWKGMQLALAKQNWGELEFARHAFLARALRGQDMSGTSKAEWEQASHDANGRRSSLVMLEQLTSKWGWQSETEELLWEIVNRYPTERWANQSLYRMLSAGGRTRPLMKLFKIQVTLTPSDLGAKNNLAMTALLLNAQELNPHELASEIYQKSPGNPTFAATYAFSLHLQKKDGEALKVMEKLKPEQLADPSIAGYYGIILEATGNRAKARTYLERASPAKLLPEEEQLFEKAKTHS